MVCARGVGPALVAGIVVVCLMVSGAALSPGTACGPPWSHIVLPAEGSAGMSCEIVGTVMESAVAAVSMEFFVDGQSVGIAPAPDKEGQFRISWDAGALESGEHLLTAHATLADGTLVEKSDQVKVTTTKRIASASSLAAGLVGVPALWALGPLWVAVWEPLWVVSGRMAELAGSGEEYAVASARAQ